MERDYVKTDSNVSVLQVQHLLQQGEVLVPATRGVSEDGGWKAEHASTGQQRLDHPLGEALLDALPVL